MNSYSVAFISQVLCESEIELEAFCKLFWQPLSIKQCQLYYEVVCKELVQDYDWRLRLLLFTQTFGTSKTSWTSLKRIVV